MAETLTPRTAPASSKAAIPRELAEELRTFAYALMGQGPLAEQIAIEVLTNAIRQYGVAVSRIIAMERVLLLSRYLGPRNGGFERPADAPLRKLSFEQRAVVALRAFLHIPLEQRLCVLACTEDQERTIWRQAVAAMLEDEHS